MPGRPDSVQARILANLERAPDARSLAFIDGSGSFTWLTNAEVAAEASRYAAGLRTAGLTAGDVCVINLPSTPACAMVILGSLLLGARPLLVAPPIIQGAGSNLLATLQSVVRRTKARIVVASRIAIESTAPVLPRRTSVLAQEDLPVDPTSPILPVLPATDDIAALQLTSGTTSTPKVCVWKQRAVLAAVDGMAEAMALRPDDVFLNWTPLYHDMGLVNNFLLCLCRGLPLALLSPTAFIRRPAAWLRALHDTGATVTWAPNFGFAVTTERARDDDLAGVRLDHVRGFWNAAERIHHDTLLRFHERFAPYGVTIESLRTNYGCAENIGGATFTAAGEPYRTERVDLQSLHTKRIARPATAGSPADTVVGAGRGYPGLEVAILSTRGASLPDGRVGRVALKTPSRMEGYLGQARETRRVIKGDYLLTGDLGFKRGEELFWVGRLQERLKVRGRQIDPSDFEAALLAVPDLRKGCFAAFGVDDVAQGTERVVLVSEVIDEPSQPYNAIAAHLRESVATSLGVVPSEIILVERGSLTKTSSGKRRHLFVRKQYLAGDLPVLFSSRSDAHPAVERRALTPA